MAEIPKPNDPNNMLDVFQNFYDVVAILRKECPWDSKQTNKSIAHLLIEEAYETIDAIDDENDEEFSKELGDLLLHIVMHSIMAEEREAFDFTDVLNNITDKLVFRHPHVFAGLEVSGEDEVVSNWEQLKKKEGKKSALDGVPATLPSLLRAERIQHKASRVGFDWEKSSEVWNKLEEELEEFKVEVKNKDKEKAAEELGDLLFSIVNVARFEELVPEEALQKTNKKFIKRFRYIEQKAKENGIELMKMSLEEMDALWNEAKSKE